MKILLLLILAAIVTSYGVDAWSRSRGGGGSWGSRRRSVSSGWSSRRRSISFDSRRRTPTWSSRRRTPVISSRRRWGSGSSSSSGGSSSFPHDIKSKSRLTSLYNQRVVKAERVERPLGGGLGSVGIKHSGVRVTLGDGRKYLVHKGSGYGKSSQTVVTDAKHMSNEWKVTQTNQNTRNAKVSDYVKAGGKDYNLLLDNCHGASKRGMSIKGK